jgi:hypothetical protein
MANRTVKKRSVSKKQRGAGLRSMLRRLFTRKLTAAQQKEVDRKRMKIIEAATPAIYKKSKTSNKSRSSIKK